MKKVYTRPELFYENFSIMEAIAACPYAAQHDAMDSCSYYDKNFDCHIFIDGVVDSCEMDGDFYDSTYASYIFSS